MSAIFIYCISNLINEKRYIGQTKNIDKRWNSHLHHVHKGTNRYLYDAMRKYGILNFKISTIEECEDEYADNREEYWIAIYNTTDKLFGYNMTSGGGGGDTWKLNPNKEATSNKLSKSNTGKKREESFKRRLSAIVKERYKKEPMPMWIKDKISSTVKRLYAEGVYSGAHNHMIGKFMEKHQNYINIPKEHLERLLNSGFSNYYIADTFSVSPATIIERVKYLFGVTPSLYRKDRGIKRIIMGSNHMSGKTGQMHPNFVLLDVDEIEQLVQEGLNVTSIAKKLGSNPSTVTSRFKERHGCIISEYRNKISNGSD